MTVKTPPTTKAAPDHSPDTAKQDIWTESRVAMLRSLWAQGLSTRLIAERIGVVSKNAVIGKAHRLGLSKRPSPVHREKEPAGAAEDQTEVTPSKEAPVQATVRKPIKKTPKPKAAPLGQVPMAGLHGGMCRYPTAEDKTGRHLFCGAQTAKDKAWCPDHLAIVYTKPKKKEDKAAA